MYYITLDLEWNQAYAEKAQAVQKRLGCRLRGEVIQIGAVKLNEQMKVCGSYSVIVKPKYFCKIHRHVKQLTGITQDMIDCGVELPRAAENFHRWCGDDFVFLTWGPDDIPMLRDNLRIHNLPTEWLEQVYDLQPIFNEQTDGETKQRSLEFAMEHFGIEQTLPAHDALNDAYFTALVAAKLDMKKGIANYGRKRGPNLEDTEIGNSDTGDQGFEEISDLLATPCVTTPTCPFCGKVMTAQDKTLHSKGQRYTTLFACKEHGQMLLSLKLHRNLNETWRAHRTLTQATEEAIETYQTKLRENEAQRKARARRRRRSPAKKQETPSIT